MNRRIGDMSWPALGEYMDNLEHALRYSRDPVVPYEVRFAAAAIIGAYRQMMFDNRDKRHMVIRELSQGPDKNGGE